MLYFWGKDLSQPGLKLSLLSKGKPYLGTWAYFPYDGEVKNSKEVDDPSVEQQLHLQVLPVHDRKHVQTCPTILSLAGERCGSAGLWPHIPAWHGLSTLSTEMGINPKHQM